MKRIGKDDVAEEIVLGAVAHVERGIELEIAGKIAGETDG